MVCKFGLQVQLVVLPDVFDAGVKPGDHDTVGELPAGEAELGGLAVRVVGELYEHLSAAWRNT